MLLDLGYKFLTSYGSYRLRLRKQDANVTTSPIFVRILGQRSFLRHHVSCGLSNEDGGGMETVYRSPDICPKIEETPGKPQFVDRLEGCESSHLLKWRSFPPNEVDNS